MAWVAGVDGCRNGWIVAYRELGDQRCPIVRVVPHFKDIVAIEPAFDVVAVDMPIGFRDFNGADGRGPEKAVRPLLGKRAQAVFDIPSRAAVYAVTRKLEGWSDFVAGHREAADVAELTSMPSRRCTIQAFGIFPKMRELDELLRTTVNRTPVVREIHPEVAFWTMNETEPLAFSKGSADGTLERIGILSRWRIPPETTAASPPKGAKRDDLLDALAALVVAEELACGNERAFPEDFDRDSHGLPIAIWSFHPERAASERAVMTTPVPRTMIEDAAARVAGHARVTPVMRLGTAQFEGGADVSFKLECLQHAGSFKTRGAFNNLLSLPIPEAGVSAASGGNHGAAVAYAARARGVKATIFVPEISPAAKVAAIKRFGAEVIVGGAQYDDAQAACDRFVAETGALKIHPFGAVETVAGQGTLGREWAMQEPDLDTVLVAVGGGGLISGVAAWFAGTKVKVVGVEPEGSRALQAALEAGGPTEVTVKSIAADSLGARNVGPLVHAVCKDAVDHVALVADEAIAEAQRVLWRDFRLAVEPGGAAALAALISGAYRPRAGERLGVLVCGANVDLGKLAETVG